MREREREGGCAWGGRGAGGAPGRAGLGRGPGQKPTTHETTDQNPITNRNPKRDEHTIKHDIRQKKYVTA
jgi:hypothetical protein